MRVQFKQAVHLRGKASQGRDYPPGIHEVPEDHLQSPFFHKLLKAGLVTSTDVKTIHAETFQERQAKLADRIAKQTKAAAPLPMVAPLQPSDAAPPVAASEDAAAVEEAPPVVLDPPAEEAPSADAESQEEPAPKKHHKHKR